MDVPSVTEDQAAAEEAANKPVKVFRIEDVSVSIFARERSVKGQLVTFYSTSFSRSYKNASGKWSYTKHFDVQDLPKLIVLANQANDFVENRQREADAEPVK